MHNRTVPSQSGRKQRFEVDKVPLQSLPRTPGFLGGLPPKTTTTTTTSVHLVEASHRTHSPDTHTHQRMASVEKTRRGLRASLVKGDVPRYLRAVETVRHEVNGGQQDSEEGRKRFHFVEWHSGCANELWKQKSHAQVCVYLNLGKVSSTGVVFCGGSCRKKSVCAASGSSPWWIGKLQSLLVLGSGDVRCLAHGGGQQARTTRKHLEVPLLLWCFSCGS